MYRFPSYQRTPESVEVNIHNVDLDREFPVAFNVLHMWKRGIIKLIMGSSNLQIVSNVRDVVLSTISVTNGVRKESLTDSFPLSGVDAASYVQRIQIIDSFEKNSA